MNLLKRATKRDKELERMFDSNEDLYRAIENLKRNAKTLKQGGRAFEGLIIGNKWKFEMFLTKL